MKKSKFTEEQITYALKQAEMGTPVAEVCRKMETTAHRTTTFGNFQAS